MRRQFKTNFKTQREFHNISAQSSNSLSNPPLQKIWRELVVMHQEIEKDLPNQSAKRRLTLEDSLRALQRAFSTSACSDLTRSTAILANYNSQNNANQIVCCGTSLIPSPVASITKQDSTPSSVRRTLPNDQRHTFQDHVSYSTALNGASGRRFYLDLTPTQESMLLRKANRYVNAPRNQLR